MDLSPNTHISGSNLDNRGKILRTDMTFYHHTHKFTHCKGATFENDLGGLVEVLVLVHALPL